MARHDPDSQGAGGADRPPLVSVIIAAYNAAGFISATCRSAMRQTLDDIEIIVVDDGSTDGTRDIVEALAATDPRIRLICQSNQGVAAARNRGIAAASGEFLAPLDADDLWDPTKLARQVARLQDAGPAAGMAYCWWAWIDINDTQLDRSPFWRIEGRVLDRLAEVNFTGSASVPLFRRACLAQVGGYDVTLHEKGSQGCEDWDLALRVAERYDVVVVPALLVGYRRRGDSMSAGCDTMWRSQEEVFSALAARQPSLPSSVFRRSSGQFALHLAGVSFWSGDIIGACRWVLRARPFTLTLTILPHLLRVFARKLPLGVASHPPLLGDDGLIDQAALSEPLIPYDRIYERHWHGRKDG